jgi:hypothetical protein
VCRRERIRPTRIGSTTSPTRCRRSICGSCAGGNRFRSSPPHAVAGFSGWRETWRSIFFAVRRHAPLDLPEIFEDQTPVDRLLRDEEVRIVAEGIERLSPTLREGAWQRVPDSSRRTQDAFFW